MTSAEAMQRAKDSMSDADLRRFRLTRAEWEDGINWLEALGIYPDEDPRNNGKYNELQTNH